MQRYMRVMYGTKSHANGFEYKIVKNIVILVIFIIGIR